MRRLLLGAAILGLIALLFIPFRQAAKPDAGPQAEWKAKSDILKTDVQVTDQLCRTQCRRDLRQAANQLARNRGAKSVRQLQSLMDSYPKVRQLVWLKEGAELKQGVQAGRLSLDVRRQAEPYLAQAAQALSKGHSYASPRLASAGEHYVVLAAPADGRKAGLIGVVHQHILRQVSEHQRKNLRMTAFPDPQAVRHGSGRFRMDTVDPDTLEPKTIRHPEDNGDASHYHPMQVVVKFKHTPSDAQLAKMKADIHASDVKQIIGAYVFESIHRPAKDLIAYFQQWNVVYAEPHYYYATNAAPQDLTPNDVLYSRYQWNLPDIATVKGWQINRGASKVIVGVVDTGVDLNHPDLQGHLLQGANFVDPGKKPMDDVGHGTHVAGVISALVDNREGVAGMTWYNPVLPVKSLDNSGAGSTYSVAQGIIWAADHGAKVINMSLGNYADSQFLHDAIRYAYNKDVVLIAASGNDNTSKPGYPAAYPEVVAVAATDSQMRRASFSNYGSYIDVAAPGVNIASTFPNNEYAALSGTSMASPHVTALAALIRSANPGLKNTEVMQILRNSAHDLGSPGKDDQFGYGLIDVNKALSMASGHRLQADQTSATRLWEWPRIIGDEIMQLFGK